MLMVISHNSNTYDINIYAKRWRNPSKCEIPFKLQATTIKFDVVVRGCNLSKRRNTSRG